MSYDDIISKLGNFGRFQRKTSLLLGLPILVMSVHMFSNVFLQAKPDHRCQLPGELPNATYHLNFSVLNESFPYDPTTEKYSSCSLWDGGQEVYCNKYVFDAGTYKSGIVKEWSLVCDRARLTSILDSIFMVGALLGSVVFGNLSDKKGRRISFSIALLLEIISGLLLAISHQFWLYSIFRVILGFSSVGLFLVIYVTAMEMVGPRHRLTVGLLSQAFFATGYIFIAVLAYYITNWRYLQTALTLPSILFLSYWWLVPESVRWLLLQGRLEEAQNIVYKIAKANKVQISDETIHTLLDPSTQPKQSKENSANIITLFKYPKLRKMSMVVFLDWSVNNMSYYALTWGVSAIGGNIYVTFALMGLAEIMSQIFQLLTLNRWGRRIILSGCMITSGMITLALMFVPNGCTWLTVALTISAKLTVNASYSITYIFSAELFPTEIRNTAMGVGSMCARLGGILAPIVNITNELWKPFPFLIMGTLLLITGTASLSLSETLNKTLPTTIAEAEAMADSANKMIAEDERC